MVEILYIAIAGIGFDRFRSQDNRRKNFLEKEIEKDFNGFKSGLMKSYYARKTYNDILNLSKIKRHLALKHVPKFEREIGYENVRY